jgi:hypothetical protein
MPDGVGKQQTPAENDPVLKNVVGHVVAVHVGPLHYRWQSDQDRVDD